METTFEQLGLALLLGLLVGLQREHAASGLAGMRTFPLITLLGAVSAILAESTGGWVLAAGMSGVIAVLVVAHLRRPPQQDPHPGTTTDVAMLLMFAVGALLVVGPMPVAIAVGGGVAVLLQFKPELHGFVARLGDTDLRAIMQFVLITCIILPVLPNRTYGPLDVLNPFEVWLMVVLIVGLSLGGYIIYKFLGRDAGILLGGLLGGAISSTATTVSYARTARGDALASWAAAAVILIASTVMYARMMVAVAIVSPEFVVSVARPLVILALLTLAPALVLWLRIRRHPTPIPEQSNPTQLKAAVVFGAMYALVLLALAAAKEYVGGHGLYAVAALSGLTEVDAITLSTARMSRDDALIAADGWRILVIAGMANVVSKTALAGILGGKRLLLQVGMLFAVSLAGGIGLLLLGWTSSAVGR